jgi:hypothetical protein
MTSGTRERAMRGLDLTKSAVTSVLFVALALCGRAAENPPVAKAPVARVALERVAGDPARENNEVSQFLGADAKGRVFLLHGDTLAVDHILPSGKIVSWREPQGKEGSDANLSDAALSPDGGSWVLATAFGDELSLLTSDDLRKLPTPHWWVSSLAYTADGPVLAVLPAWGGGTDAASRAEWETPPFLLRLDGQTWQTLNVQDELKLISEKPPVLVSPDQIKAERDVKLAAGRNGALWATQQNAYLLKRYSRQGAVEESVAVNGGRVEWKERTEEDFKALDKTFGRKINRAHKMAAVRVVRGLTVQANRVYQVVETPEGVALDRWDNDSQVLDRLLLGGIAPGPRYLSLAAGHDGLYIAARGLGEPIWRLDWQRLEDAKWKAVAEAVAERPRKQ